MGGNLKRKVSSSIADNYIVEQITLTAQEALDMEAVLSFTPAGPEKVTLDVIGGTSQKQGLDYEVIGNKINWNGKSLETALEENDELRVIYAI